jgi:uncharacterized membrane protein YgcG
VRNALNQTTTTTPLPKPQNNKPQPPPPNQKPKKTGEICLDILKNAWSPAWTLHSVCQAVLALMSDPAADSPLNCDAGNLLRNGDTRGFNALAKMYTVEHAMGGMGGSSGSSSGGGGDGRGGGRH